MSFVIEVQWSFEEISNKNKNKIWLLNSFHRTQRVAAPYTYITATMPTVHWPGPIVLPPDFDDAGAPDPLLCPITQCLMTEPALVVSSGRTYERAAIVRWISEHGTDPLDRETSLNIASLAPNLAVRQMVDVGEGTQRRRLAQPGRPRIERSRRPPAHRHR